MAHRCPGIDRLPVDDAVTLPDRAPIPRAGCQTGLYGLAFLPNLYAHV
jgi:hypothetical protein